MRNIKQTTIGGCLLKTVKAIFNEQQTEDEIPQFSDVLKHPEKYDLDYEDAQKLQDCQNAIKALQHKSRKTSTGRNISTAQYQAKMVERGREGRIR